MLPSHPPYRNRILNIINDAQKNYWSKAENRNLQAERVEGYFKSHPEAKEHLAKKAKAEWADENLLRWRRQKTAEQWTPEFRIKRRMAYDKCYFDTTMNFLKNLGRRIMPKRP